MNQADFSWLFQHPLHNSTMLHMVALADCYILNCHPSSLSLSFLSYPVILSIENHCSVLQQKKMAQYLVEILGDKLDVSSVKAEESGRLPSPESLRGKILVKVKSESCLME